MLTTSPDYLRAMGLALLAGREFRPSDRLGAPSVVMVTQSFAAKEFPGRNALGKQLDICWDVPNPVEIVGIVSDYRQKSLDRSPRPTIFIPASQSPPYYAALLVRTTGHPASQARGIQEAIHRVNPDQALYDVQTMEEVFSRSVAQPRFQAVLLTVFAGVALLLATIGVYGVAAYSVAQRTREIGIRVVLGATRRSVATLVLREGLVLAAGGVAVGLAGSLLLSRVMGQLLFEIQPNDPATLSAVSAMLILVVVFALLVPARRAARVAPVVALREE
jgi:predicted permease